MPPPAKKCKSSSDDPDTSDQVANGCDVHSEACAKNCSSDQELPKELETGRSCTKEPLSEEQKKTFSFSEKPSLETLRQMQARFVEERNWDQYHSPRNLLLAMVGEVGELAELFQWRGEVKPGLPDWSEKDRENLSHELSDVFIYLLRLAEKCHIDLPTAALQKMEHNARKYPAQQVYGSSKKYTEYKNHQT